MLVFLGRLDRRSDLLTRAQSARPDHDQRLSARLAAVFLLARVHGERWTSFLLTIFVLNSQRRQAERDRIRADMEYQVNLKAQLEIMQLHQKMDRLAAMLVEKQEREKKDPTDQ